MKLHNRLGSSETFTKIPPPGSTAKSSVRRKNNLDIKPDEIVADFKTLTRCRWISEATAQINLADLCANRWSEVPFDEVKIQLDVLDLRHVREAPVSLLGAAAHRAGCVTFVCQLQMELHRPLQIEDRCTTHEVFACIK
jgi:hypothetical protein